MIVRDGDGVDMSYGNVTSLNHINKALDLLFRIISGIKQKMGEHCSHNFITKFHGFSLSIGMHYIIIEQNMPNRMSELAPKMGEHSSCCELFKMFLVKFLNLIT